VRPLAQTDAHEGPVYVADEDALYFTSVPPAALKRLDLATGDISIVLADANRANGMTLDAEGRLVVCEQGTFSTPARITRYDRRTGERETLVEDVGGLPLNSPNDVVVARDGSVWFTDPSYGFLQGFRPRPRLPDRVYRHDPATGETTVAADGFDKPNGLAFSPDERVLYVADNGAPHHLLALENGSRRVVARSSAEHPDGLKVDADGRIFVSFAGGVQVLSPGGEELARLDLPGAVNFCFGPGRELFVTTDTAVWSAGGDPWH
jgi:gluconolactonase